MMKNNFLPTMIILILFISSCSTPQKEFDKIKKENKIESFNQFIEKYPENDLTRKAIHMRDSLAFTYAMESNKIDSLEWFINEFPESNFLNEAKKELGVFKEELALYNKKDKTEESFEKLAIITSYLSSFPEGRFVEEAKATGEKLNNEILSQAREEAKKGLSSKNNNSAANAFVRSGELYLKAISYIELTGQEISSYLERAAYAYYKASLSKQIASIQQFAKSFNEFVAGDGKNLPDFSRKSSPHIALRNQYYQKAVELYKKAGKTDHAKWMEKEDEFKKYTTEEIETEWKSK
jgi:hypothetical protein